MTIRGISATLEAVAHCRDGWTRHGTYCSQAEAGAQCLLLRAAGWQTRLTASWGRVTVWKRR